MLMEGRNIDSSVEPSFKYLLAMILFAAPTSLRAHFFKSVGLGSENSDYYPNRKFLVLKKGVILEVSFSLLIFALFPFFLYSVLILLSYCKSCKVSRKK